MNGERFATLDNVFDNYAHGILSSSTLDSVIPSGGMALTTEERQAILSFLDALTDKKFIDDNKQPD